MPISCFGTGGLSMFSFVSALLACLPWFVGTTTPTCFVGTSSTLLVTRGIVVEAASGCMFDVLQNVPLYFVVCGYVLTVILCYA